MIESASLAPPQRPLHLLNRLAFGPRPGDIDEVTRIGVERWIEQQLHPDSIPDSPELLQCVASLSTLQMTPVDLFAKYQLPLQQLSKDNSEGKKNARQRAKIIVQQAAQARLLRAIESRRQLHEVLTAFWFNHFNVFAGKGLCHLWVGSFEYDAIRPHTMGRFRELLGATARHPAMLFYLDNWQNTAPDAPGAHGKFDGINENYARELMELHTLGVGNYSQADVIALAHLLTGWGFVKADGAGAPIRPRAPGWRFIRRRRIPNRFARFGFGLSPSTAEETGNSAAAMNGQGFFFNPRRHDFRPQVFLGRRIENGGIEQGEQALDILARSPATARHLSYKLAQHFVADEPPVGLVQRMSNRYLASDGSIREVLETLFFSPEFWDPRYCGVKFKTPYEFVISATRASGVAVLNERPLLGAMAQLGMPLYGCQTPDGFKDTQNAWLNPDAMMTRLSFATALSSGRLPLQRPVDEFAHEVVDMRGAGATRPAALTTPPASDSIRALEPAVLAMTLGDAFSPRTIAAVKAAPPELRSALILGSPEFMRR